jgi:hypothetical protein
MIVFRDQRVSAEPTGLVSKLRQSALSLAQGSVTHDAAVHLLIEMGTVEAAIADAIFTEADGIDPITRRLREASTAMGHALWHTWNHYQNQARPWLDRAAVTLAYLETQALPDKVQISVPEGYAYYGVYPEMYLEAGRRCREMLGACNVVCLGLRSIGTSLSAAVIGALEELGCQVASYTLRPRGHPFSRRVVVSAQLAAVLQADHDASFLIVDEGPGISGSSIAGTATALSEMGIADDRILLLPSWSTDGSTLLSEEAKNRWGRHRQCVVSFEEVWLDSGRLSQALPPGRLHDVSAGAWRERLYGNPEAYPAVQPQHERRKYLFEPTSTPSEKRSLSWLSFAGLGGRVLSKLSRAEQLASSGFTVSPERMLHGFSVRPFTPGAPIHRDQSGDANLLETVAAYLAHLTRDHAAEPSVNEASLAEMITTNVVEGLGEEWLPKLDEKLRQSGASWCERTVALDGRMQPHEWIRTDEGYLKMDAMDHHDDHFFPGCQDIAWDVAAACLEFEVGLNARRTLIKRYRELSDDTTITERLPLHAVTYLAFRLGYASMAASTLGDSQDGSRFSVATERYRRMLKGELCEASGNSWDA